MSRTLLALPLVASLFALGACSPEAPANGAAPSADASQDEATTLTLYSGRSEDLVAPLLEKIEGATGVTVEVRYAGTAELAGQLLEEGDRSPASLFFSQDAGALGELSKAGLLAPMPQDILDTVEPAFRDPNGSWVATSGRIRVLAVNPETAPDALGYSAIDDLLDPANRGQIGIAPTNASFQSFVTALRVAKGEVAAEEWLTSLTALEPKTYEKNTAILEAVDAGEIGIGLINHYYWHQLRAEVGDDITAELVYLDAGDPGALLNVAGVGILNSADDQEAAAKVAAFLVSDEAQQFFADETAEYPVVSGITSEFELAPIDASSQEGVDLNDLDSLADTQALLRKVGLI
ncbi:MAG TPA: iron ABC transporter substrate-binding protein [Arachnia sp.]|nr:iron ABC transporter substrate-binding protein [Arachnia sp.]